MDESKMVVSGGVKDRSMSRKMVSDQKSLGNSPRGIRARRQDPWVLWRQEGSRSSVSYGPLWGDTAIFITITVAGLPNKPGLKV